MSPRLVRPFLALLLGLALAPPGLAQAPQPGYPEPLLVCSSRRVFQWIWERREETCFLSEALTS